MRYVYGFATPLRNDSRAIQFYLEEYCTRWVYTEKVENQDLYDGFMVQSK